MNYEYFLCECEYHKKLCKTRERIEEAEKKEYTQIKVERWQNRRKQNKNQKKQINGEYENK